MRLDSGVKLFSYNIANIHERFLLSAGMETTNCFSYLAGRYYLDNAIVPKNSWRKPYPSELDKIIGKENNLNYNESLSILKSPKPLLSQMEALSISELNTVDELKSALKDKKQAVCKLNNALGVLIDRFKAEVDTKVFYHGFFFNNPGQTTVAINGEGKYIGLHIDNSSNYKINERASAKNLLFFNIGPNPTSFLFINKTVDSLIDSVSHYKAIKTPEYTEQMLVIDFFSTTPDYPVIKLRIDPGEIVLIPVNNIIHDSCTIDATEKNTHLSLVGRFSSVNFKSTISQ